VCTQVLGQHKENAKAYFRRAQARRLQGDIEGALADSVLAQSVAVMSKPYTLNPCLNPLRVLWPSLC